MRSHHTPPGVAVRSVSRNAGSHVPLEWLDAGSWRLPSGKALAEFALQAGFLAPLLFRGDRSGAGKAAAARSGLDSPGMAGSLASTGKDFGKGDGR